MLRRTASKAFGVGGELKADVPPAEPETRHGAALARLFSELHRVLERELLRLKEDSRLSRPRSQPRGVEFRLEGPRAVLHFVNGMRGLIHVSRTLNTPKTLKTSSEEECPFEILSLHRRCGHQRPIRKPLPSGDSWPLPADGSRSVFHFTSIPELASRYLAAAGVEA